MKRSQMFICALMLVAFAGCKTQEDIRREQTVQNLNSEIQETNNKGVAAGHALKLKLLRNVYPAAMRPRPGSSLKKPSRPVSM